MSKTLLPENWSVPQVFRDRLGTSVGRQRAMFADGHLLLILHEPPQADQAFRSGRVFWRNPQGEWSSNNLGQGIDALNKHLSEYADLLAKFDAREEQARTADEYFPLLTGIVPLKRAAHNMHRTLQEARQIAPDARELIVARDQAYDIARTAELLHADMQSGLECAVAHRNEQQAESGDRMARATHRLNMMVALFFPIATLSAIFGMQLTHGLESLYNPYLFWIILVVGVAFGVLLRATITTPRSVEKEYERRK